MAKLEGTIYKFFEKLAKTNLLIFDDFGLTHLEKQQQMDFMEMIEDRHGKAFNYHCQPTTCWKLG